MAVPARRISKTRKNKRVLAFRKYKIRRKEHEKTITHNNARNCFGWLLQR